MFSFFGGLKLGIRGIDCCVTRSISTFGVVLYFVRFSAQQHFRHWCFEASMPPKQATELTVWRISSSDAGARNPAFASQVCLHQWGVPNIVRLVPARSSVGQLLSKDVFVPQGWFFTGCGLAIRNLQICPPVVLRSSFSREIRRPTLVGRWMRKDG